MAESLDLSIIIVNWRSAEFVRQSLESIYQYTTDLNYEIIVIDNASFDDCEALLKQTYPQVTFLQSFDNVGFAKANNRAFEVAGGSSILFLNPDTRIIASALDTLHDALTRLPAAGAVGAKLLNSDNTIQTSCIQSFPTITNQMLASNVLLRTWSRSRLWGTAPLTREQTAEVEAISGACLMVRREAFEHVGRFSEDYFMYSEDIDLCYKLRGAGWKNYFVPDANIIHFGGESAARASNVFSSVLMRESIAKFLCKTRGKMYSNAYRCAMLMSAVCRLMLLTLLLPVQALRGRYRSWMGAVRRWSAIFLWCSGVSATFDTSLKRALLKSRGSVGGV